MRRLRWSWLCILLLVPLVLFSQKKEHQTQFFVKVLCDKTRLVQGDSCLVSFVGYATHPFQLKRQPEQIKVKKGRLRRLKIGRQPMQQVVEKRKMYFARVLSQYVLSTKDVGEIKVPSAEYVVELHVQEQPSDPFDAFFGRNIPVRKIVRKAHNEEFYIQVVEKPRRTMREMRKRGLEVF